jgi:hypothetical protein
MLYVKQGRAAIHRVCLNQPKPPANTASGGQDFEGEQVGVDFKEDDTGRGETVSDEEFLQSWSVWRGKPCKLRRMLLFHRKCQDKHPDLPPTRLQLGLPRETPARPRPRPRAVRLAPLYDQMGEPAEGGRDEVVREKVEQEAEQVVGEGVRGSGVGRPTPLSSDPGQREAFSNPYIGGNPNLLSNPRPEPQLGEGLAGLSRASPPSPSPLPPPSWAFCTWSPGPAGPIRLWWSLCGHCHTSGTLTPIGVII